MSARPVLLLDTSSPLVSVALARGGEVVAARSVEIGRTSTRLLAMVREVLEEAGTEMAGLGGIAVLRGPGSFTGVRVGLATVLGFHQALGMPVATPTTFQALAAAAPADAQVIVAAVDALRGEWSLQAFAPGEVPHALSEPELVPGADLPRRFQGAHGVVIGFGVSRLAGVPGWPPDLQLVEPGPLAPAAARLVAAPETVWDPSLLTHPLYARPPAITPARPRIPAPAVREA
ncbi:MAG TPA: tRNA (adenosine(37)-N6)-threonylcarbamoyltransferase complex dimerization subunit type 1 TsaB [Thermoanaerobaculia bacterium]|nr:tRNA (adenosine(37)-N6)-threonylcarbamoyltransferase complex dimerization subunit type 1 TsaB [Thermoanaerobaculia bacterium]